MKIYLCNEVLRELDFADQCRLARDLGFDGLEIAPFTLSPQPHLLARATITELRRVADGEGIAITGLHWLLSAPPGLSITEDDNGVATRTLEVARRLIELCVDLGGSYLVHGSPQQRLLAKGQEISGPLRALDYFSAAASEAHSASVTYILEPLGATDTGGLVRSIDDAMTIIKELQAPALATMLDCYATGATQDIIKALERWVPEGAIHHVHFNDANQRGPGEGSLDFVAILDTLRRLNYAGASALEPFVYLPDGPSCAARSLGYLRGIIAAQAR